MVNDNHAVPVANSMGISLSQTSIPSPNAHISSSGGHCMQFQKAEARVKDCSALTCWGDSNGKLRGAE